MAHARNTKKLSTRETKKKIKALQRQLSADEHEETLREKEARRRLKTRQKKGVIERPKGTAGRHFNLQKEMKLDGKDAIYNKIRYKVIEIAKDNGLRLDTTIRYQPPMVLGTIITLAMLEIPHLANFQDGWPVKDFLQQFLQNHGNYRRRMGYDKPASNSGIKVELSKHNVPTEAHVSTRCAKTSVSNYSDSDDSSGTDSGSDDDSEEELGPGSEGGLPTDVAELFKKHVDDFPVVAVSGDEQLEEGFIFRRKRVRH